MNNNDFYQQTDEFYQRCREKLLETADKFYQESVQIMKVKGGEYAGSDEKFANFNRLAVLQEIRRESIWFTYFVKHFDSLTTFIRRVNKGESISEIEATLSEPIAGRIKDMINYLLILYGMIEEEKEKAETAIGSCISLGMNTSRRGDV